MKSLLRRSTTPFGFILALCSLLVLSFGVVLASRVGATSVLPVAGQRLITIHDRGQNKGIITRATTLRDAFREANITIDSNDMVEPGLDEPLVANNYEVNVYRARPVTIIDGAVRQKVMSSYQTAKQITAQAHITLHDEDTAAIDANTDIVSQGAGVQLSITRATPFTLVLYGTKKTAYTQEKTVGDMLRKKGVHLAKDDTLSVTTTSAIQPGMTIELWRNGKQTATEEQDVAFEIEKIQDADQPVGYRTVKTPGVVGKKTVTYEIEMKNGQQVSRTEIQSVVTQQPTKQVEVVGTKSVLPPGSHEDWMAAAGISPGDYGYVNYIVGREGGWCPVRWQGDSGCIDHGSAPSDRGYGIVQATPGSKMASAGSDWLTNPITQLRWATGYAVGRYGSWEGAYNHWTAVHSW